jgi:hypothetical protein
MRFFLLIFASTLASCVYDDPHQYFLRYQARQIGRVVDDGMARRNLIDDIVLSNGNGQVRYWYVRPYKNRQCIEIYEYEPITRKILKASFEGNQCIWNP